MECSWLHANYSGRVTPDGLIVTVALAVVLVSMNGVGVATALWVEDGVRVLDVLGDMLCPVVRRGQIIK